FAEHGAVFNIAVYPFVQAQIFVYPRAARPERITIVAENYGETFAVAEPEPPSAPAKSKVYSLKSKVHPPKVFSGKHALLEAAFAVMQLPDDIAIEVHLHAEMPPGASTGTSAAVSAALIGALDRLT